MRDFLRITFAVGIIFVALTLIMAPSAASEKLQLRTGESIVKILNAAGTGGGTGFVTKRPNGQAVTITNWHVCAVGEGADTVRAVQQDAYDVRVRILAKDPEHDLCMLEAGPSPALKISKKDVTRFNTLYVVGHPHLKPQTPVHGQFTAEIRDKIGFAPEPNGQCLKGFDEYITIFGDKFCLREMRLYNTTVPIFPGNSGSPVLNSDGEVVGVMNSHDQMGRGGMIPLDDLKAFLAR